MQTLILRNPLLERLRAGEPGLSIMLQQVRTVEFAAAASACGYDAVTLDLEHSAISVESGSQIAVACLHAGVTPLVRVPDPRTPDLLRMLDAGCLGVIVPHVESTADVEVAVRACKFMPRGNRSVSPNYPHFGFRKLAAADLRRDMNAATMVIAMIESAEGLARCAEIAAVDGVDVVQLGCNDFCESLGIAGQLRDPRVSAAMDAVIEACRASGKAAGFGGLRNDPELSALFLRKGARYVAAGNEWSFMMQAATRAAAELRATV